MENHLDLTQAGIVAAVQESLTDELRAIEYRGDPTYRGYCYVASRAVWVLLGEEGSGYRPYAIIHEETSHFYLMNVQGEVIDPTSNQFQTPVPYTLGQKKSFRWNVSKNRETAILLARAERKLGIKLVQEPVDRPTLWDYTP